MEASTPMDQSSGDYKDQPTASPAAAAATTASGATASAAAPTSEVSKKSDSGKMFSLKKWNAVAMWSWDVECDTCAICRVQGEKKPPFVPTGCPKRNDYLD
jgi:hypothetical protein